MLQMLLAVIYLAFISLGLPDALLGAAWPSMVGEWKVPVSYAGAVSMLISLGTIVSSLQSDRLTRKLGTGAVTALSVALTALTLFGFSLCRSFPMLCLLAVPYGLGAGSVDAALNNYVALHYASRHMSWLHCMWGIGASLGPLVMGKALTAGLGWPLGYQVIAAFQVLLTAAIFLSLPLWRKDDHAGGKNSGPALSLRQVLAIPGAIQVMGMFLCYCALESTAGLWAASYLTLFKGVPTETAAGYAGLFYIGITVGRALSGFLTLKLDDDKMIRLGQAVVAIGILGLLLPVGELSALAGLVLTGLGCAPIYPCVIHSTPNHFGAERSQAVIGVQMASAYVGSCLMPPVFGLLADRVSSGLLPAFLGSLLLLMVILHERLLHLHTGYTPSK